MDNTEDRLKAAFRHVAHFQKDEILQFHHCMPTELQRGSSFTRFRLA